MKKYMTFFLVFWGLYYPAAQAQPSIAKGEVLASIAPIHSLVSAVMDGAGEPALLVEHTTSLHGISLKPSERRKVHDAKLLFLVNPHFELFLAPLRDQYETVQFEALTDTAGLVMLPLREKMHVHEAHHGHEEHDDLVGEPLDYHIWLSPDNAILIAKHIQRVLAARYPEHQQLFERNSLALIAQIEAKKEQWEAQLLGHKQKPFVVFHDAYQYLERYFRLNQVGTVTFSPEFPASIAHFSHLNSTIHQQDVACIFIEPQFSATKVEDLAKKHGMKIGTLDPLGFDLLPGKTLYISLIQKQVDALVNCLQ